jgi:broad specificity polyphosphatase/5'/3'-nucleotidase SurE
MKFSVKQHLAGSLLVLASLPASALNILLTNDDGYDSYGINQMRSALEAAGHTVYVSAPLNNQSGKSGGINTDHGSAVDFQPVDGGYAVDGTPADSANAGLFGLFDDAGIDLVISGANDGENVSLFSNASGTVGAAMWALRRGYPSIAVSVGQDIGGLRELGDVYEEYQACAAEHGNPYDPACLPLLYQVGSIKDQVEQNAEEGADYAANLTVDILDTLGDGLLPEGFALNVNVPSGAKITDDAPVPARVTESDNAIAFDLVIVDDGDGGLEVGTTHNPLLAGLLTGAVTTPCEYLPVDQNSEGQAFACGNATIAIFNGNFDASQDNTDQAKDLACSLEALATVEIFNCDGGDGNGNGGDGNGKNK